MKNESATCLVAQLAAQLAAHRAGSTAGCTAFARMAEKKKLRCVALATSRRAKSERKKRARLKRIRKIRTSPLFRGMEKGERALRPRIYVLVAQLRPVLRCSRGLAVKRA